MCVEEIGEQTTLNHITLPKLTQRITPQGPHLCCLTCKIPEQRAICAVVCGDCKEIRDKEWIYNISYTPMASLDTNPAFVYAIQATPPTEEATTPPGPPTVAATQGEKLPGRPKGPPHRQTFRQIRKEEGTGALETKGR
jgi:hypothetical protein